MNTQNNKALKPSGEQIIYANLLIIGVWAGIIILMTTYAIYLTGILPAHVEMNIIPTVWSKGVSEFLEITHSPHGWGWASLLAKGDFLNYVGFALLALMTIVCYLVLVRGYIRQKNWIFSLIAILEIVVLTVAASGILGGGGH
jgi:type IV secretory pathway VirB6-like protein